jgi:hypothetical protein
MTRYVAPIATIAVRDRTTRSTRILDPINDQPPDRIGRYADWGGKDDIAAPPKRDEQGPSMLPRNIRAFGLLWIPAVILLLTVELWAHVPQVVGWISLVVLFVAFLLFGRWLDRRAR